MALMPFVGRYSGIRRPNGFVWSDDCRFYYQVCILSVSSIGERQVSLGMRMDESR